MTPSIPRRRFLQAALAAGGTVAGSACAQPPAVTREALDRILAAPVLDLKSVKQPVKVAAIELLRNGDEFLLRTRSADGLEVVTVPNPARMADFYPVLLRHVVPTFIGKDARDLEALLWD